MVHAQVTATQWACDGCGAVALVPDDIDFPAGFVFDITHTTTDGDRREAVNVYACRVGCVRKAVNTVLPRTNDAEQTEGQVEQDGESA